MSLPLSSCSCQAAAAAAVSASSSSLLGDPAGPALTARSREHHCPSIQYQQAGRVFLAIWNSLPAQPYLNYVQVLQVSFENSFFFLCSMPLLLICCKQRVIPLQILPLRFTQYFHHHFCSSYYVKYFYNSRYIIFIIYQSFKASKDMVKKLNKVKLPMSKRFHSTLFTLEMHLLKSF